MGRAFEFRKARKLKRWGNMAKTFTRLGKQIAIAVAEGGPDPDNNAHLRAVIATCRHENMPKDNIDRAIKNAIGKDKSAWKSVTYEGYGPHGIAVLVDTLTDNTTRTVADVRSVFNKFSGNMGTTGSLSFLFDHYSMFTFKKKADMDMDEFINTTKRKTRRPSLSMVTQSSSPRFRNILRTMVTKSLVLNSLMYQMTLRK